MKIDLEKVLECFKKYLPRCASETYLFYDEENEEYYTVLISSMKGELMYFIIVRKSNEANFKIVEYFYRSVDLLEYLRKEMDSPRYEFEFTDNLVDGKYYTFKIVKKKIGEK